MDLQIFSRSKCLNNLSSKKVSIYLGQLSKLDSDKRNLMQTAWVRYAESNIPLDYWDKSMEKNFVGEPSLLKHYNNYISDLKKAYLTGDSFCLAGPHGVGKTLATCNILKQACNKGYSCLYTTLSDVVHIFTKAPRDEVFQARKELMEVDFAIIDEFDNRFMPTENAADLYARTLESVFRTRSQNKMPTLMCTNSPNVINSFNGSLRESIDSLFNGYMKTVVVLGEDFRKS